MRLSFCLVPCLLSATLAAAQTPPPAATPAEPAPAPAVAKAASVIAPAASAENLWLLDLSDGGRVSIQLRPDIAPQMVERIRTLTRQRFYDGLTFHRVIDGFMAQGGDPKGDGTGGSQLPDLPAEFNTLPHVRGAVAAARAEKENSANSQFYIVLQPRLSLDKKYTVFGRVIDGMAYVDGIEKGEPPANPTRILHAYIGADNPPPYQAAPAAAPSQEPAPTLPGTRPKASTPQPR
ncbi:peptidylprolyl isomerase [Sphingomonas sp.]|jgi:cyclophilin family peptidyl-prolyl cis-trans isomerase|uniref:peptidylprolyl isomerase n=1 Tax=Sphingomonas sp. TaxID=28214 RepID=UPI0035C7A508